MADWDQQIIDQILATAGSDPDQLARAGDAHFNQGQYQEALFYYLVVSRQQPEVAEHQFRMGLACARLAQNDAAQFSFEQAIQLKPGYAEAHSELSRFLLGLGNADKALVHAKRAVELEPDDADYAAGVAELLELNRDTDAAWKIVEPLIRKRKESPSIAVIYGRLARLQKCEPDALQKLLQLIHRKSTVLLPREQSSLHLAAAQLLDQMGRYDDAFEHASIANELRQGIYLPTETERQVGNWINYFTPQTLPRLHRATHASQTPVFIVGMPRSGSTLVEQILASHPSVHGAGELGWIERLWPSALQRSGGTITTLTQCLDQLSVQDANGLAAEYLTPLLALSPQALRITDKMPLNFIHLGLIAVLFPEARIIHCRRDPRDTCLSCYMTDFTDFSYGSLPAYGHFHRQVDRMMAHWKTTLDLPILEVQYEEMVGDAEAQTRRLIDFVGLPWDDGCLRFHENKRLVATASQSQVRQPIYQKSVARWRHYEKYLGPLESALNGSAI